MLTDAQKKSRLAGPSSKKVKFTRAEDAKLALLVREYSDNDWKAIAEQMAPRTARQCRERWTNYVNPELSKDPWTKDEDQLLIEKHNEFGNHWKIIEKYFPNRSKNNIKHRWSILKSTFNTQQEGAAPAQQQNGNPQIQPTPQIPVVLFQQVPKEQPQQPLLKPPPVPQVAQQPAMSFQMPFSDEPDAIKEFVTDPFQFFDRVLDSHDAYMQPLAQGDMWSIPEENFF